MNTCDTCKHWMEVDVHHGDHRCDNKKKLGEPWDVDGEDDNLMYAYDEDGSFYPGPKFGCVHHQKREE